MNVKLPFSICVSLTIFTNFDGCEARPLIVARGVPELIIAARTAHMASRITLGTLSIESLWKVLESQREEEAMKEMDIYGHDFTRSAPEDPDPSAP
jgi:hypothetical protein